MSRLSSQLSLSNLVNQAEQEQVQEQEQEQYQCTQESNSAHLKYYFRLADSEDHLTSIES